MKLVDTSAWIEFLRKKGDPAIKQAVARLIDADLAAWTCPVRFELLSGARPGERADVEQVLGYCRHIPFECEDWREAAAIERQLRSRGLTIPRNDLFVAAAAIRAAIPVICRDAHFDAIRRVLGARVQVEQVGAMS